jgi:hypothetical protein
VSPGLHFTPGDLDEAVAAAEAVRARLKPGETYTRDDIVAEMMARRYCAADARLGAALREALATLGLHEVLMFEQGRGVTVNYHATSATLELAAALDAALLAAPTEEGR